MSSSSVLPQTRLPIGAVGGPVEAQEPSAPFCGIAFVGEAPGRDEVTAGYPFAGAAGAKLDQGLEAVGIDRKACLVANPFRYRPENNRINLFFASEARSKAENLQINKKLPAYLSGYCLRPHDDDVRVLWKLLRRYEPKVIVALGNTALWAVCWKIGITKLAGQQLTTPACGAAVVPTYHPSYLLRRHNAEDENAFVAHLTRAKDLAGLS